jgi:hypothetical protein
MAEYLICPLVLGGPHTAHIFLTIMGETIMGETIMGETFIETIMGHFLGDANKSH